MCDEHGNQWDFNCNVMRAKAKNLVKSKAALLLVVSPMYAAFSRLQTFNAKRMGPEKVKEMLDYGVKHATFALDLSESRDVMGCIFFSSLPQELQVGMPPLQRMLQRRGVQTYGGVSCCYDHRQLVRRGCASICPPGPWRIALALEMQ